MNPESLVALQAREPSRAERLAAFQRLGGALLLDDVGPVEFTLAVATAFRLREAVEPEP